MMKIKPFTSDKVIDEINNELKEEFSVIKQFQIVSLPVANNLVSSGNNGLMVFIIYTTEKLQDKINE